MDQATLVSLDLQDGQKVVDALDAANINVPVALLMSSVEENDWTLVLSSPDLDHDAQLKSYQRVAKAVRPRFNGMLPSIEIVPMKDPFIRDLRKKFAKTKDVKGMRLGSQFFGNRFINEGYVFRIR